MQHTQHISSQKGQQQQLDPLTYFMKQNGDLLTAMLNDLREIGQNQRLNNSLLADVCSFFREPPPPPESYDLFKIVTLFKPGFGSNWIPNKQHRQYLYVYAPVPTAVSVTSSLGTPFVLTIPAVALPGMWNKFDIPDQSSVYLDSTATANSMNLFTRETNVSQ